MPALISLLRYDAPYDIVLCAVLCLDTQLCPALCNPMDYILPGSSVPGDSPGKNTRVGCHALLLGIFPTQGSNPGLPHCRQTLYHLSHQGRAQNSRVTLKGAKDVPSGGRYRWRRKWHPTSVLLPGKSHGRRSVVGCSPWGRKDTTEGLHFHSIR